MKALSIFLLLSLSISSYCQEITDPKELFEEGQFFFQREDYKEALYFFTRLTQKVPGNANYNYKVGECYLNIPGQEHLAVSYFEAAAEKTVPKREYEGRNFNETSAPLRTYFYLGNAYRMAGELDKALKSYNRFIDSPYFIKNYNLNVVETEIFSCERAKIIQDSPIEMQKTKLTTEDNLGFSEFNAVKSKDGKTFVFVRGLKFYDAIFYSVKTDDGWSKPVNINQEVVSDGDYYPTGLNHDGTKLLLVREKDLNSDIYMSQLKDDGTWSPAKKLPGRINTAVQETFASFGTSDEEIYVVSDRQGGQGGKDIFVSMLSKGLWGKPKNLGKEINTEYDEETPVICEDGKSLFFSSKGHYNMGGFDIFYSYQEKNKWINPRNIGYPLNSTRDDLFYIVDKTCKTGLYSIIDPETGVSDIYEITVEEPLALPQHEQ
jgi:tetratricopeptide (TPR) repeat protein